MVEVKTIKLHRRHDVVCLLGHCVKLFQSWFQRPTLKLYQLCAALKIQRQIIFSFPTSDQHNVGPHRWSNSDGTLKCWLDFNHRKRNNPGMLVETMHFWQNFIRGCCLILRKLKKIHRPWYPQPRHSRHLQLIFPLIIYYCTKWANTFYFAI